MERYEFSEGSSNKFWEIKVEGTGFTVRYGRIGSDGQTKTKSFDSEEKARHEANKLIASKTKKGYVKVGGGDAEAPAASGGGASASNAELEEVIYKDPDSDEAWQVYADWLQEQDDPRGQIIALELAGKHDEAAALLKANVDNLLGPLAEHQTTYDGENTPAFKWRRGFVHAARFSHDSYGDEDFEGSMGDILTQLLDSPSGKFVKEMTFVFNGDPNEDDLQNLIDILIEKKPRGLRKLHFGDYEYCGPSDDTATGLTEISWYAIGDLSKLWPSTPDLHKLITQCGSGESTISGEGLVLGDIDLPELRHAEFRTGGLEADNARAIAKAKIPKIERLDIWYGDDMYGGDATPDDVKPLLDRTDLPNLKRLGLMNATFTDELPALCAESALVKQLEVLDLSMGCLTEEGAKVLIEKADAFAHLKELDVTENYLSDETLEELKAALPNTVSREQREDDDPEYRSPAVAE